MISVLGSSLVATCITGSSLVVTWVLAGTIWTWQITFLLIMFCLSTLLMVMTLSIFPARALVRALLEWRQSCATSSGLRSVSSRFAAGFWGDGGFLFRFESEERELEVSQSTGNGSFVLLLFFIGQHFSVGTSHGISSGLFFLSSLSSWPLCWMVWISFSIF